MAIRRASANDIMEGRPDGRFDPEAPVRRAEFLAMVLRTYPQDAAVGTAFVDVPEDHWAYRLISQARGLGLVQGDKNRFYPDEPISRAEMAVLLQRFLALPEPPHRFGFPDVDDRLGWARPSVEVLAAYGLVGGLPEGRFAPAMYAKRAEAAVLIARLFR